jgi:RNA polymerase sigma factor (sigma-70 family)
MSSIDNLFRTWYPRLVRSIRRRLHDADAAEDVVQEAFVRLLEEQPREPAAWLTTVAVHLAIDHHRADLRRVRTLAQPHQQSPDETGSSPDEQLDRAQRIAAVRRLLQSLGPRDRQLLLLYHEGRSYKEIAMHLGVAPSSIGPLLVRAHARFLACCEAQPDILPGDQSRRRGGSAGT